jgi:large subunit ribosomal protein L35
MEEQMPKLKTHRGAAKRFKLSASGKIKRWKGYKSQGFVAPCDSGNIKRLLPYA